jgi:hypothetical protein
LNLNRSFDTTFAIDETEVPQLGIHNDGRINRKLATQEKIGDTSFSATLNRVQYGTYNGASACLVAIDFSFRFKPKAPSRYSYASIHIAFNRAIDVLKPKLRATDLLDDPKVVNIAPKEVYGTVHIIDKKKTRNISIPLMFESQTHVSTGIEGLVGTETTEQTENRMEIHGQVYYDDDHDEEPNAVSWDLYENKVQKDGIFQNFRAAMVVANSAGKAMWMDVTVKPSVKFSMDPRRLLSKGDSFCRLLQLDDEPVLLDGKTPKEGQVSIDCDDFSSGQFPWDKVLWLPVEYQVR